MKKINSYYLYKHKKNEKNNLWRRNNENLKNSIYTKEHEENTLSFLNRNDKENTKSLKYLQRNFSGKFEFKTQKDPQILNIKLNVDLFSSLSNYLSNKQKKIKDINNFKENRQENLKKLLKENKSDHRILKKTFSKKIINKDEIKNLSEAYERGHVKRIGYPPRLNRDYSNPDFIKTQTLFHKYKISPKLNYNEKNYLNSINQKSSQKINGIKIKSPTNYYKSQYDSYKSIQKNKNLYNIISNNQEKELIKNYLEKELINEENNLKSKLMPKIHVIELSRYRGDIKDNNNSNNKKNPKRKKEKNNNITSNNFSNLNLNNFIEINSFPRKDLFEEYNFVYIKGINKFILTPTCRKGAKMIFYNDENTEENKIILFGGVNIRNLNDIWECTIKGTNKHEKKYVWKKINITENIPSPRNGHTMSVFQGNIFIYGGIVDQMDNKTREDILIYNINQKKFFIDYTLNKASAGWRNYHISEIVGPHMFIYGGENENGEILADPFALDLSDLKWIQAKFNTDNLPKRKFHSSCQVFPESKRNSNRFYLFKVYNDSNLYNLSKIVAEGIYIFGGIDENNNCSNDLMIIKRGKPLTLFKVMAKGSPPAPRCQCSMDFFEKLMVVIIYGGRNEKSSNGPYFNDMFFLDVQTLTWINIELNDDNIFPSRGSHCSCIVDNELIIFGGNNEKYFLKSDLLICNLDIFENLKIKNSLKAKKYREIMGLNDSEFINNILLERQKSNYNKNEKEEDSSSATLSPKYSSYNFLKNFPKLRNVLQEKFNEVNQIHFKSSDEQKIKDIIKESSYIS